MKEKMVEKLKQVVIISICMMMMLNVLPIHLVEVKAANLDALKTVQINGESYTTDGHEVMAYRLQPGTTATYDVFGKHKGRWIQTTYQRDTTNRGYVPRTSESNVTIKATPKFINEGRYIQMTYTLTAASTTTTSFSVAADIMIDDDDEAPITAFSDGSGFKMVNSNNQAQFNFYGKNAYGTNPGISTYWFGYYYYRDSYRYTQTQNTTLKGTDSAMACSWKALNVNSRGTTVSMIIGTGEANTAPEVGEIVIPDDSAFVPGKDVSITVPIENATGDNAKDKLKLYYTLLKPDGTIIDGPNLISDVTTNVSGAITNFVATFKIPNFMPSGPFTLRVYAMNAKGGISAEVSKSLTATGQPIKITSTTGDITTSIGASKVLSVTLTSSSTPDNPLLYQWQKQERGVYVDINTATQSTYSVPVDEVGTNTYRAKIRYKNDTTSTVYSPAMNVSVDKAKSTTTINSTFDNASGNLSMEAKVSAAGGQSANGDTVKFYNGNALLGSATISSGRASLVVSKENLMSGPYTLHAIYAGNATLYSSTSSSQSLNVNLTMQILYDQFIQANDNNVLRSYKEGIESVLKDPAIAREGYAFVGWMSAAGELMDRISATLRGDVRLTSQWKKTSFEVTLDDNLGSTSTMISYNSGSAVTITAPDKANYTFSKWVSSDASLLVGKEHNASLQFKMPEKDVSLLAQYRNAEYTISYSGIDAQANWPTSYTYGSKKSLPAPSKADAMFLGWHKNSSSGEIITEITTTDTGTITLYPAWSQLYQVSIKNNVQGTTQTPITALYAANEEVMMPAATIIGYKFKQWKVISGTLHIANPENETLVFAMPAGAIEIEAEYVPLSYEIEYHLNEGINNDGNLNTYTYGVRTNLKQPTRVGYRFDGWFSDAAYTTAKTAITESDSGRISLYAKWTKNSYSLSLTEATMEGGETSKAIGYGERVMFKANTKNGYTFTKWQNSNENLEINDVGNGNYEIIMPDYPVTIKAEYEKTRFNINYYNVEGIDISGEQYPKSYVLGYEWTFKNPIKEGYTFGGWYSEGSFTSPITKIDASHTGVVNAYGKWSANSYKLDIEGGKFNDGSISIENVPFQSTTEISANEIAGMRFIGWFDQAGQEVSKDAQLNYTMPAKNIALQARFEAMTYTVSYDLNAGSYEGATINNADSTKTSYTYGDNYTFAYPTMKDSSDNTLMTFDGWKIKGTDTKVTTITPTTIGNLELVATWVAKAYTISYEGIEGSENSNDLNMSNEKYNTSASAQTIELATPSKIGYEFTGWTTTASNVGIVNKTAMTLPHGHTGDITLTATWAKKAIAYTIDGVAKSAQIDDVVEVKLGTLADGQEFVNWKVSGSALLQDSSKSTTTFVMSAAVIKSIEEGTALQFTSQTRNATYALTYSGIEGAINNNPTTYVYGTGATLSAPNKTGYTFTGWESANNEISTTQFGDIKLTATWTAIDYTVNVEGGSASISQVTRATLSNAHIGDTIHIEAEEKAGYEFSGWSLIEGDVSFVDAQLAATTFVMSAGDVNIKATYTIRSYKLTYMDGEETILSENPALYTIEDENITLKDAKKDGYDFKGWYDNADFSGDVITTISKGSTIDKTFFAKFEKLHNTITFEQSGLGSYEVKVNGSIQEINDKRFSTQDRGLNVRINFTPKDGYSIAKILVNGVEYNANSELRFDDFFGNYTVKVIFSGSPTIDTPTSGDHNLTWSAGDGKEDVVDTYTKDDVEIETTISDGIQTTYQVIRADASLNESDWLAYVDPITLSEEGSYIVYIRSIDGDGNTSIIHSKVIVIDKTAPTIKDASGDAVKDNSIIYVDQSYSVDDSFMDKITVNGSSVTSIVLLANQKKTYSIVLKDKAGNETSITVFAKNIEDIEELVAIKDITQHNVKKENIAAIQKAILALDQLVATGAQKAKIDALKATYNGYLSYLETLESTLSTIHTLANEEGWNIQKEQELRDTQAKLEGILGKDNLNATDLETAKTSLIYLKDKVKLIELDKDLEGLNSITKENVKTKQETIINEVLDKIKDIFDQGNSQIHDEASKNALRAKEEALTTLKEVITTVIDKIANVKDKIHNQNLSEAIGKDIFDAMKDIIKELCEGKNIDEEEKRYLGDVDKVLDVNEQLNEIQGYNPKDVTTKDRERLHDLIDQISDVLKDNKALNEDKTEEVKKVLDSVQALVNIVDEVFNKLENIKDVINSDLSKPLEEERIDEAKSNIKDLMNNQNVLPEEKEFSSNSDRILDILKELNTFKDTTSKDVNVSQEQALKDLLDRIQKEKDNIALSKEKWEELTSNTKKLEDCIQTIQRVNDESKRMDTLKGYKDSNDLLVLEAYIKAVEDYLTRVGGNLTSEQHSSMQKDLQEVKNKVTLLRVVEKIISNNSEASITGLDGLKFDKDVQMSVIKVKHELSPTFLANCLENLQKVKPGYAFDEVYDIQLLLKNQKYSFEGRVEVRIKLSVEQQRLGNLGIVYINDQGDVEIMKSRVENGYIMFEASHFSNYAIIYLGSASDEIIKNTGNSPIQQGNTGYVALACIALVGMKKRKNIRSKIG